MKVANFALEYLEYLQGSRGDLAMGRADEENNCTFSLVLDSLAHKCWRAQHFSVNKQQNCRLSHVLRCTSKPASREGNVDRETTA